MTEETDPGGGVDTLPPATVPERPELRRSAEDRVLSGVAGGLARTLAVDAVIVRVVTVVLAITFPPAFVAYLAAWLLVARDGEPSSTTVANTAIRRTDGAGFWIGAGVLTIIAITVVDDPFPGNFNLLPLILIGIGVALWTRDGARARPPVPPSSTASASATTDPTAFPAQATALPAAAPRAPRPRSPLGAVALAVALIVTGVVAALDQVAGVPIDAGPSHVAAVALLVLGIGLVVGAFWGRARWLLLVALLLLPPVLGGALYRAVSDEIRFGSDLEIGDGIGERDLVFDPGAALPADVRLLAGSVRLDLTRWEPADTTDLTADEDLVVTIGAGEVIIRPPTDVAWRLVGDVGLGEVVVRDGDETIVEQRSSNAPGDAMGLAYAGGPTSGPVLDIVVRLEFGGLTLIDPSYAMELS